jgi:hypothetical protein
MATQSRQMIECVVDPPKEAGHVVWTQFGLGRIAFAGQQQLENFMNRDSSDRLTRYARTSGEEIKERMDPEGSYEDITAHLVKQGEAVIRTYHGYLQTGFNQAVESPVEQSEGVEA